MLYLGLFLLVLFLDDAGQIADRIGFQVLALLLELAAGVVSASRLVLAEFGSRKLLSAQILPEPAAFDADAFGEMLAVEDLAFLFLLRAGLRTVGAVEFLARPFLRLRKILELAEFRR